MEQQTIIVHQTLGFEDVMAGTDRDECVRTNDHLKPTKTKDMSHIACEA